MNTPYTPGPWMNPEPWGELFAIRALTQSKAEGYAEDYYGRIATAGKIEDAQLIAAAPELAEALEWLIPYLEFRSEQSGICLDDGIKVAKKAWAKAVAKTLEKALEKAGPLPAE